MSGKFLGVSLVALGLAWAADGRAQTGSEGQTASPAAVPDGTGPLPEAARAAFWGSAEDPPPEVLDATREDLQDRHYLYSDELNLDLFLPHIQGLGGAYAGVGSDQAYLFMGHQRPVLAWLTDYDPWIEALHMAYAAFFEQAETIDAFMDLWDSDNEDSSRALLEHRYAEHPDRALIIEVFEEANRLVHRRLRFLVRRMTELEQPTFVTDEATYQYVRDMVRNGRVRPMTANLLDDTALVEIGRVSHELGVPLRVFYTSNAEEYWDYTPEFRANIAAQNFDDRSVILRARASKPQNGDYCYNVQNALNFRDWLAQSYVRRLWDVWRPGHIATPETIPFSVLNEPPHDR